MLFQHLSAPGRPRSTLVFPNKVREPQAAEARRGWEAASFCSHCQRRIKITPSLHKGRKNPGVWCQNPGLAALPARSKGLSPGAFLQGRYPGEFPAMAGGPGPSITGGAAMGTTGWNFRSTQTPPARTPRSSFLTKSAFAGAKKSSISWN